MAAEKRRKAKAKGKRKAPPRPARGTGGPDLLGAFESTMSEIAGEVAQFVGRVADACSPKRPRR
jgi:hypothetical protein